MEKLSQKSLALGKGTGSVINWMMSNNATMPEVGKGATILQWTDRSVVEVLAVSADFKKVTIADVNAKRTDEHGYYSESQSYDYSEISTRKREIEFYRGKWCEKLTSVEFDPKYYAAFEKAIFEAEKDPSFFDGGKTYEKIRNEWFGDLYRKDNFLRDTLLEVKGKTVRKTKYEKISIIFGVRDAYRDPCF